MTAQGSAGKRRWYRLDNAAKIYPAVRTRNWTPMFRIAAALHDEVDEPRLLEALRQVLPRFESFAVRLRTGVFWYYLEPNQAPCRLHAEGAYPCFRLRTYSKENGHYLFRVIPYRNRISLEVFHALSDGGGALIFFKTLLAQYLRLGGVDVPTDEGVLPLNEPVMTAETEDAYRKYANLAVQDSRKEARAWVMPGTPVPPGTMHVVTGILPLNKALAVARGHKVSLTEYLVSVQLYALLQIFRAESPRRMRPVRVSVPVNLRRFYPTNTLRNFSYMVNIGIDPRYGHYTFEEILTLTSHSLRYRLHEKFLNASVASNVASERNPLLRVTPLFLKNLVLRIAYTMLGESRFSSTLTNLGAVALPEAMRPHIRRFDLILGTAQGARSQCAAISYEDALVLTFSRNIQESFLERAFFSFLVKEGIPVQIESNQE